MSHDVHITGEFVEKSTPKITAVIKDEDDVVLPGSALDSLTLTLYDLLTDGLLGGRSAGQDILGANGGAVDESGNFTLQLTEADMAIVDGTRAIETHVALVEWVYSTVLGNKINIYFKVANLNKVT